MGEPLTGGRWHSPTKSPAPLSPSWAPTGMWIAPQSLPSPARPLRKTPLRSDAPRHPPLGTPLLPKCPTRWQRGCSQSPPKSQVCPPHQAGGWGRSDDERGQRAGLQRRPSAGGGAPFCRPCGASRCLWRGEGAGLHEGSARFPLASAGRGYPNFALPEEGACRARTPLRKAGRIYSGGGGPSPPGKAPSPRGAVAPFPGRGEPPPPAALRQVQQPQPRRSCPRGGGGDPSSAPPPPHPARQGRRARRSPKLAASSGRRRAGSAAATASSTRPPRSAGGGPGRAQTTKAAARQVLTSCLLLCARRCSLGSC